LTWSVVVEPAWIVGVEGLKLRLKSGEDGDEGDTGELLPPHPTRPAHTVNRIVTKNNCRPFITYRPRLTTLTEISYVSFIPTTQYTSTAQYGRMWSKVVFQYPHRILRETPADPGQLRSHLPRAEQLPGSGGVIVAM
jgi:hypothetical protein